MSRRFEGRCIFITGAAAGQGRAHALRFAREGANIIAVDLASTVSAQFSQTIAAVEASGARILPAQADVCDEAALTGIAAGGARRFGGIDIVVANAGVISPSKPLSDVPRADWKWTIGVNLLGAWATCRATVPHLIAQGRGGAIVLISSIFGLKGRIRAAPYAASKHGVVGLMRSLALELAEHSIRVNSIHPTTVETPMLERLRPPGISREQDIERLLPLNALPAPWVAPDDISNAVAFLASDEARYITGVALPVDAGALLK